MTAFQDAHHLTVTRQIWFNWIFQAFNTKHSKSICTMYMATRKKFPSSNGTLCIWVEYHGRMGFYQYCKISMYVKFNLMRHGWMLNASGQKLTNLAPTILAVAVYILLINHIEHVLLWFFYFLPISPSVCQCTA